MIRFSISFKNPYAKDVNCQVLQFDKRLTKNKSFEAEHFYDNYYLLNFSIDTSWRGSDHAGPEIELCFLGYSARYKIYDHRHWDYSKGKWNE